MTHPATAMKNAPVHKPRPMVDLLVSIVIPSVILMKFSGNDAFGATTALIVALAFPLGWGLLERFRYKTFNFIAVLGLISVLLSYPVIALPSTLMMLAIFYYLWRTIHGMTGLALEEIRTSRHRKSQRHNI